MTGDVLLLLLVMVLGCAAFVFGILYLFCHLLGVVGRGIFGIFRRRRACGGQTGQGRVSREIVCPRKECRHVDYRNARFCSQCGQRLDERV